jgi:FkbM family methyltransferase
MSRRKKFRSLVPRHRPNQYRNFMTKQPTAPTPNETAVRHNSDHSREPVTSFEIVPYDENLLERSRTQWQLGDWGSLTQMSRDTLQHHPDRAKLALLAAAGHLQTNSTHVAKELIRLAQSWGCSKTMVSQVLVSGVYNGLGRAALAIGQSQRALTHFKSSAAAANPLGDSALFSETIALREGLRLGLMPQAAALLGPPAAHITNTPPKPPDVGITSYAQNFEDVMLWRALGRIANGFYIDVGAQDPLIDSVSKAFYEKGWRGVHVEPIAAFAEALRSDRPDERVIEAVLAAASGTQALFEVLWTGLSTASREFAERHRQRGWDIREITVSARTLAGVFEDITPREIHWLKVDVEGMEEAVFAGWGHHPVRPWVIVVEATEPNSQTPTCHEWEHHLHARDYDFVYFDGLNRFYVHAAHIELKPLFKIPPNVFDGFSKYQPAKDG